MKLRIVILVAVLSLGAFPQQGQRPVRFPARGTRGAVTGGAEYATEAGMRMLTGGGNAVDAGIAAMKMVAVTSAPVTGLASELVSFTRTEFTPLCGGDGSVLKSTAMRSAGPFIAAAAPAPGGGGVNDPIAACSCDSESTRKFAELTMRSPTFKPVRTTALSSCRGPTSISRGSK